MKFNNRPPNIALEKKGKNGVGGNYLIENSSKLNSDRRKYEYYLRNAEGQTHKLELNIDKFDIELNWKEYQILYFEFTKNSLFIIINSSGSDDWIAFKYFSLETGEVMFWDGGIIPCEKNKKPIDPQKIKDDWSLGNPKCNWINFQSHQISYIRSSLVSEDEIDSLNTPLYEYNVFSYNWMENKMDTLPQKVSVGMDAVTGRSAGLRNINYNDEKGQFEY